MTSTTLGSRSVPRAVLLAALGVAVSAQQFVDLPRQHLPSRSVGTAVVAAGDIDGDGDLDLAFGSGGSPTLRLARNEGQARFASLPIPTNTDWVFGLALFDADRDGDLDLYAARGGHDWLLLNDGTGTFTDASSGRIPAIFDSSREVIPVDVDGDGDLDLVVANVQPATNRLLLNDGTGHFTDATSSHLPPAGFPSIDVEAGDLDGDGDVDLLFGNDGTDSLLLNDGSGHFVPAATVPWDQVLTYSIALADYDGDGDLDLVAGVYGRPGLRLFRNDGRAGFSDDGAVRFPFLNLSQPIVAAGDVDRDGDADLLIGNSLSDSTRVLRNDGTGRFSDASAASLPEPEGQDTTTDVLLRDLDQDGWLDVLVTSSRTDAHDVLLLNDGTGRFASGSRPVLPHTWVSTGIAAAAGDLDGDGRRDVLLCSDIVQRLFIQRPGGHFVDRTEAALPPPTYAAPTGLALADVDGDLDLDFVVGAYGYSKRLLVNDGHGVFKDVTDSQVFAPIDSTQAVVLADVDGDSDSDLLTGVHGQSRLCRNDGGGVFRDDTAGNMPVQSANTQALAAGDVDGDGDLDLVLGNNTAQTWLYRNDGTGRFTDVTAAQLPNASLYTSGVLLGDLDRDGDLDLLLANGSSAAVLYLNDGGGTFTDATAANLPFLTRGRWVAGADVDLDGDLDLLLTGVGPQLLVNDGVGRFAHAAGRLAAVADLDEPLFADLDDDGDAELIDPGYPIVYTNTWRHVHVPYVVRLGRAFDLRLFVEPIASLPKLAAPFVSFALATRPFPIPPLGRVALDPATLVALPLVMVPGTATVDFTLPKVATLFGLPLCVQTLVVHDADPATWRLTNTTFDALLR